MSNAIPLDNVPLGVFTGAADGSRWKRDADMLVRPTPRETFEVVPGIRRTAPAPLNVQRCSSFHCFVPCTDIWDTCILCGIVVYADAAE